MFCYSTSYYIRCKNVKWIGQHIWSLISRFRNDVYFEAVPDGTIASGKNLGLDSDNKLVKESDTGVTDLHGAGVDGNANQLLTDDGDGTVTSESTLTYDSATLTIGADDVSVATLARKTHSDSDGGSLTVQGGNATGANKTGGDVIIDAGEGTGSGAGGRLIFKSHAAGSSGSTSGSTGSKATFDSSGNLSIEGDLTVKGNDIKDDDGTTCITFDSSGNTTIAGTTSGTFSGNLTGNASGTAATVTGGTQSAITTCANLTTVGTIGTGVWQGTAIASNYLDSDTAHLSGVQTFLGPKTFAAGIIYDGDRSTTPGDGAAIHVDSSDITDNNTSASGTATAFRHVNIENPRILASNALVTTTTASTVFIKGAPVASTNQTITNAYALEVAAGDVKLGADLLVEGNLQVNGSNANINLNAGSDIILEADNSGGSFSSNIAYRDSGGTNRIILGADSDVAIISNRASNGTVQIRANTSTAGSGGEVTVVTVHDDKVDISQDLNVTGIIKGKQRQIYQQSFLDDLGTTKHYLPWRDTDEQTTIYQEEAAMVAPYDGRIVSVTMRCSALSGGGNRTIGVHTFGPNASQFTTGNWTEEEVEAVAVESTDDNHVFYFVFDNAKHFESGELVTLSIQDDADLTSSLRYTYVSTVVEWDYNNGLGTGSSSAEYDSAQ